MVDPATPDGHAEDSDVGRRRFLTYMVAAPTLTVGAKLAFDSVSGPTAEAQPAVPGLPQSEDVLDGGDLMINATAPTSRLMTLEVTTDNRVRFELPRAEVGQGLTTTVAMIVAEELDVRPSDVVVELSKARPELLWNQFTAGSTGVRTLWSPLRSMAAAVRARLLTAAAERWNLSAKNLTTRDLAVFAPDGKSATYGSLSADAARVKVPAVPGNPKSSSQYKVVGKPTTRIDARDIVTGKAKYTMDVTVPGAVSTVVIRPPTMGGTVASVDDSAARSVPGFVATTRLSNGVAVSAKTFHEALKAKDWVKVTWNAGPVDGLSDSDIQKKLADKATGFLVPKGLTKTVEASFDFAFVTHAPMEVLNAVADVKGGKAEVWCPSQTPIHAQQEIAKELGLPTSAVTLHVTRAGGSFGRWLFNEPAIEAALVSKAIGKPVKLMWTRNDDMRHGRTRPATHHKIRAAYALDQVLSFEHRMASVEVDFSHGLGELLTGAAMGKATGGTTGQLYFSLTQSVPYNFGGVNISLGEIPMEIPTGSWRSVHSATFRTAEEVLIDELAKAMGKDPVQFRMQFLKSKAAKGVLRKVAEAGKWGRTMPKGWAQGVACHEEHRSSAACLIEMNATDPKNPRVTKAVIAIDVGRPINPRGLQAQMAGGLHDAISTVLQAGLHIDKGAVREGSFEDYRWAKQRNSPPDIEVHIMPATGDPGGAGELGVPVSSGAVANAYARATGTQVRRFPINF